MTARRLPLSAWVLAAVATAVYLIFSTLQWLRFDSPSWDLGIFTQAVQAYAELRAPIVHIKGPTYHLLGDHFHPILVLLAPWYAAFPSAYTLLVAQAVLLGVSAFFVAAAADHVVGRAAGWLVGAAYAFSWGVQQAAAVQFHEVAFAAPILAIGLWAFVRERWVGAALWWAVLVFVKEDLGVTVFALGLVLAWRSRRWLLGGGLALWGAVWFVVTVRVILPAFNPEGQYDYGSQLGWAAALADPWGSMVDVVGNADKLATVFLLLACTGLLALRSPLAWALLPTLGWRFLSTNSGHWGPTWHYSLVLMPIVFVAALDGIRAIRESGPAWLRAWAGHGPAIMAIFAVAVLPQQPLWQLTRASTWQVDGPRQVAARTLVDIVPAGSVVAMDSSLMGALVARADVYFLGTDGGPVPDLVVIDNRAGGWNVEVDAVAYAAGRYPGTTWTLVFADEGYQLVARGG